MAGCQSSCSRRVAPVALLITDGVRAWSGRAALPQSRNRYSYTPNNPLRFVDPSGLIDEGAEGQDQQRQPEPPQTGATTIHPTGGRTSICHRV